MRTKKKEESSEKKEKGRGKRTKMGPFCWQSVEAHIHVAEQLYPENEKKKKRLKKGRREKGSL